MRLLASDAIFVDDVFIKPRIADNTVSFSMELEHTGSSAVDAEVRTMVLSGGKVVAEERRQTVLKPGGNVADIILSLPDAVYWSPDNPHLYTSTISVVVDGKESGKFSRNVGLAQLDEMAGRIYNIFE